MSDIHGASRRFHAMLKKIKIDWSQDYLYINGDIVDRGKDSLKLFNEIRKCRKQLISADGSGCRTDTQSG